MDGGGGEEGGWVEEEEEKAGGWVEVNFHVERQEGRKCVRTERIRTRTM